MEIRHLPFAVVVLGALFTSACHSDSGIEVPPDGALTGTDTRGSADSGVTATESGLVVDGATSDAADGPSEAPQDSPSATDGLSAGVDAPVHLDGSVATDLPAARLDATDAPFGPDGFTHETGTFDGGASETTMTGAIKVSTALLDFGSVTVGVASTPQSVLVTVSGGAGPVAPFVTGSGFALSATTCAAVQSPGSCAIAIVFAPALPGAAIGVLSIGTVSVALSGIGLAPATFTATDRIDLGTLPLNVAAPVVVQIVPQLSVDGLACSPSGPELTLSSQTCPATGTVTTACTYTYTFQSSTVGAHSDSIVCSGGGKTTLTVVTATVVAPAALVISPTSLNFAATVGGSDSATLSIANTGGATSGMPTVALTTGVSDFSILSNDCVVPLAPLGLCRIEIGFNPTSAGAKTGTLTVTDASSGSAPAVASLQGTAVAAAALAIAPAAVNYGTVSDGTSKSTTFTLKNAGGTASDVLAIASTSGSFVVGSDLCSGLPLAAGAQCTFSVTFTPTSTGAYQGLVTASQGGAPLASSQLAGTGF